MSEKYENEDIWVGGVKLTDREKAQLAIEQWRRTQRDDIKKGALSQPMLTGALSMTAAIFLGRIVWYRFNRHKPGYILENYILTTRVYTQCAFVYFITGFFMYDTVRKKYFNGPKNSEPKER